MFICFIYKIRIARVSSLTFFKKKKIISAISPFIEVCHPAKSKHNCYSLHRHFLFLLLYLKSKIGKTDQIFRLLNLYIYYLLNVASISF